MPAKLHTDKQRPADTSSAHHIISPTRPQPTMQHEPIAHAYQQLLGSQFQTSSPSEMLSLQHSIGNQAVQRLLVPTSPQDTELTQRQENNTGLPDTLKAGVESLSGISLDDVQVHYNSSKPAQVQALAYTQGTEIHMGPGQEQHLAHEAWHTVQQKQGRVKPTLQVKGMKINDDERLEQEANYLGTESLRFYHSRMTPVQKQGTNQPDFHSSHAPLLGGSCEEVVQGTWKVREGKTLKKSTNKEIQKAIKDRFGRDIPTSEVGFAVIRDMVHDELTEHTNKDIFKVLQKRIPLSSSPGLPGSVASSSSVPTPSSAQSSLPVSATSSSFSSSSSSSFSSSASARSWERSMVTPLITLINNVLQHGILSREEAYKKGLAPVGSADTGKSKNISVNTFALKEGDDPLSVALKSMSAVHRGSISVSLERENDTLLSQIDWKNIELEDNEKKSIEKLPPGLKGYAPGLIEQMQKDKAYTKALLSGPLKRQLDQRAQSTILAILGQSTTGISSPNVDVSGTPTTSSSAEVVLDNQSEILLGQIRTLLVPHFIQDYSDLIKNPTNIPIEFVGIMQVSAYYKAVGVGDFLVENVVAPNYVEAIARHLREQRVISTHILTTNPSSQEVPPDFDD